MHQKINRDRHNTVVCDKTVFFYLFIRHGGYPFPAIVVGPACSHKLSRINIDKQINVVVDRSIRIRHIK